MASTRPEPEHAAAPRRPFTQPEQTSPDRASCAPAARRWRSTELFGAAQEVEIEHGEAVYRLRRTSLGKLILTK
jgi:hemin uptake protein HemP